MKGFALRCRSDGYWKVEEFEGGAESGSTLDFLQAAVGGLIECVSVPVPYNDEVIGVDMWVNEEGLLLSLPLNKFATQCHELAVGIDNACIVGDVVFTGGVDEEGYTLPLEIEQLGAVIVLLLRKEQEDFDGPYFSWAHHQPVRWKEIAR